MHDTRVASARQVFLQKRSTSCDEQVELERSFFKSLSLPNGTHKTTAAARLTDLDRAVCDCFDDGASVRLLDVGISSGVTTLELLDEFERRGINVTGIGADICVHASLSSFMGIDVLHDSAGNVLQVATPFFARGRPDYSQNSLKSNVLRLALHCLDVSLIRRCMANSRRSRRLSLVSPRLLERPRFTVVEHDIGLPMPVWEESFDVIRAANILNLDYFSPSRIAAMITNVQSWLKKGGLLLVCRTSDSDGTNHGSLYCKSDAPPYLELVHRYGKGSEVDSVINAASPNARPCAEAGQ